MYLFYIVFYLYFVDSVIDYLLQLALAQFAFHLNLELFRVQEQDMFCATTKITFKNVPIVIVKKY